MYEDIFHDEISHPVIGFDKGDDTYTTYLDLTNEAGQIVYPECLVKLHLNVRAMKIEQIEIGVNGCPGPWTSCEYLEEPIRRAFRAKRDAIESDIYETRMLAGELGLVA